MKIKLYSLFRYALPLRHPLFLSGRRISHREGILVCFQDEHSNRGYGDVCPLPGLHRESFSDALLQLRTLNTKRFPQEIPEAFSVAESGVFPWLDELHLYSSVRLGLETALLNLVASARNVPAAALFGGEFLLRVPVNALLSGPAETFLRQAREYFSRGIHCLKVKVGREETAREAERIFRLREALPPEVSLRLDANQAWNLAQAVAFGKRIGSEKIEYIEEPLRNPRETGRFFEETGIPVALDESLWETSPREFEITPGIGAFILKPDMLGGLVPTMQWCKLADSLSLNSIISAAFSSAVGLLNLAHFSSALRQSTVCMGLGTFFAFRQDLIDFPNFFEQGVIRIFSTGKQFSEIKMDLLRALETKDVP